MVGMIASRQKKNNLVLGYTGFPRIRMLRSIFPDAKFVQCIRDPRSIAFHLTRMVEEKEWTLYERRDEVIPHMPDVLQERLSTLKVEPLSFCGVYVRWMHECYREEMEEVPKSDRIEIAYSDILSRPMHPCSCALVFANLPVDKRFTYYVRYHYIQKNNVRLQRNLNEDETELLAQAIAPIS